MTHFCLSLQQRQSFLSTILREVNPSIGFVRLISGGSSTFPGIVFLSLIYPVNHQQEAYFAGAVALSSVKEVIFDSLVQLRSHLSSEIVPHVLSSISYS